MGKTSKNQNYFLISAVILGSILTCFTKPYNYTDRASFKHSFSLLFVHSTPAIQMLMQDQSHGQLMKTQTKTSRRQRKLSNHHEEEEAGRQTISALLLLSRVESAHLHLRGSPSPAFKRRGTGSGAHAGRFEPSSEASFGIKLLQHPASCWSAAKGTKASHTTCFHSKEEWKDTEPMPGSGQPHALAPYLLEVTLRGFADCRLTGDNAAPATAVLARIRLPECVILQIKLETRPMQHKARPVLTTGLKQLHRDRLEQSLPPSHTLIRPKLALFTQQLPTRG